MCIVSPSDAFYCKEISDRSAEGKRLKLLAGYTGGVSARPFL